MVTQKSPLREMRCSQRDLEIYQRLAIEGKMLLDAAKLSAMHVEFEGFGEHGEVDAGNNGRMFEHPEVPSDAAWRGLARRELARRARVWEQQAEGARGRQGEGETNRPAVTVNAAEEIVEAELVTPDHRARLSLSAGLSAQPIAAAGETANARSCEHGLSGLSGDQACASASVATSSPPQPLTLAPEYRGERRTPRFARLDRASVNGSGISATLTPPQPMR